MKQAFERFKGPYAFSKKWQGALFAIGNFDGVHLGHQLLLQEALDLAKSQNKPAFVLTFEPHPKSFFSKNENFIRLTSAEQKANFFEKLGFQGVIEQDFEKDFSDLEGEAFIEDYLIKKLSAHGFVVGEDFCFGKNRTGDRHLLEKKAKIHNLLLKFVPLLYDQEKEIISSTRIRDVLKQGQVEKAAKFLGYRFYYQNIVEHGLQLGRKIGYPTANLSFKGACPLAYGVYAVKLRRANGLIYNGVASVGVRPTVTDDNIPLLETYLFDFDDNLYEENVTVSFFHYLRPEEKFKNLEDLIYQIEQDVAQAKSLLAKVKPISKIDEDFNFTL